MIYGRKEREYHKNERFIIYIYQNQSYLIKILVTNVSLKYIF